MWYQAFGWTQNPFSIRPSPHVVGLEETKEALLQDLLSGTPALLLGPTGMGKTSLLLWLKRELRAKTLPLYLNLHGLPHPQGEALRAKLRLPLLLRRLRLSSGPILLFDEAQGLEAPVAEWLKALFDQGLIFSFALAACAEPPLPQALRARIGPHAYTLRELSPPERVALLKARMDGRNPFTEEALLFLAEAAGPSPRALLQAAELACKRLAFKAELREPITPEDLAPLFPQPATKTSPALSRPVTEAIPAKSPTEPAETRSKVETRDKSETRMDAVQEPSETPIPSLSRRKRDKSDATSPSETKPKLVSRQQEEEVWELSPMQREILRLLSSGPKSVAELSALLRSSAGSVRRQLSRLHKPGLVQPLPNSRPKKFSLTDTGHKIFEKVQT